jgi:hypothetical protein
MLWDKRSQKCGVARVSICNSETPTVCLDLLVFNFSHSLFCFLLSLLHIGRIIHASVLLTDVANNAIFRSFMFELPWQFGITALSCYLFGVANTLSHVKLSLSIFRTLD